MDPFSLRAFVLALALRVVLLVGSMPRPTQDPMGVDVIVDGLPEDVTKEVVTCIFELFGKVARVELFTHRTHPCHEGNIRALVTYPDKEAATASISTMNGGIPEMLQEQMDPTKGLICSYMNKSRNTNLCTYFQQGRCLRGEGCAFMHPGHVYHELGAEPAAEVKQEKEEPQPREKVRDMRQPRGYGREEAERGPEREKERGSERERDYDRDSVDAAGREFKFLQRMVKEREGGTLVSAQYLPSWVTELGMYYLFAPYGAVLRVSVSKQDNLKSATVAFAEHRDAQAACQGLNGLSIDFSCPDLAVTLRKKPGK